jgi:hypothetical protein
MTMLVFSQSRKISFSGHPFGADLECGHGSSLEKWKFWISAMIASPCRLALVS